MMKIYDNCKILPLNLSIENFCIIHRIILEIKHVDIWTNDFLPTFSIVAYLSALNTKVISEDQRNPASLYTHVHKHTHTGEGDLR